MSQTIEQRVEYVLREYLKARDDDRALFIGWIHYHENLNEEEKEALKVLMEVFKRMPSLESLTRARRILQAENVYLRGENYQKRQTREKQMRKFYEQK